MSDTAMISAIHRLSFKITRDTKLSMLQYKIIHNILPHGSWLHEMNLSESPLCEHCNELETLTHMLVNCTAVWDFWNIVLTWWNNQNNDNYAVNEVGILYSYKPEGRRA